MGSGAWAIEGAITKELLSFKGAVLWHDNPKEIEYLFPKMFEKGARTVELPKSGLGRPLMRLRDHPDMKAISFPIHEEDFRLVRDMRKE